MDFEDSLKHILTKELQPVEAPMHLKYRILSKLYGTRKEVKMSLKKKIVITCMIAILAFPSLAFGSAYLIDEIYGSREKIGASEAE